MRDIKKLVQFTKEINNKKQEMKLFKNLKKEVETGANGTQKYVIKMGHNRGKVV